MLISEWYMKLNNMERADEAMKTALDLGCEKQ
jgi:hypothetical protein